MPSGEKMAKFVTAFAASGNARTTTVRAFAPDKFAKLAADVPSFWQQTLRGTMHRPLPPFCASDGGARK